MRCAEELLGIGQEEQVQRGGMSKDQWIVGELFGIFCLDDAAQPSASGKLTRYLGPSRSAGPNHVLEDAVDGIFVENTDGAIIKGRKCGICCLYRTYDPFDRPGFAFIIAYEDRQITTLRWMIRN